MVGAVLLSIEMAVSPLGAQSEVKDAEFKTITCRRINVVDGEGTLEVEIVTDEIDGGKVTVWDKDTIFSLAVMGTGGYGGEMTLGGKEGPKVEITTNKQGSAVFMYGKESVFPLASMGVYKQNGVGSVGNNAGGSAMISTNEHGGVGWRIWQG